MLNRFSKLIFFITLSFLPCLSFADDYPLSGARWYKIYWNNIYIADLKAGISQGEIVSQIDSQGVVKTISHYSGRTYSKYSFRNGVYIQDYFESRLQQRQGTKEAKIYYSDEGKIRTETISPPENPAKRQKVADDLKIGALNPLFAAFMAHKKIKAALITGEKSFILNTYDGRRLAKLEFNILGTEAIKNLDKIINVVKINFRRMPIAGFTNQELKRMKGEEPDIVLYLDPETLLPIKADAAAPLGMAKFVLAKECLKIEECE